LLSKPQLSHTGVGGGQRLVEGVVDKVGRAAVGMITRPGS
jgi:hypothetical protein